MTTIKNPIEKKGEHTLGVLYDDGKVRRRREWRGVKDTFYDYTRWLYLVSVLAKFIVKPRNVKGMFRYRWMANTGWTNSPSVSAMSPCASPTQQ